MTFTLEEGGRENNDRHLNRFPIRAIEFQRPSLKDPIYETPELYCKSYIDSYIDDILYESNS